MVVPAGAFLSPKAMLSLQFPHKHGVGLLQQDFSETLESDRLVSPRPEVEQPNYALWVAL